MPCLVASLLLLLPRSVVNKFLFATTTFGHLNNSGAALKSGKMLPNTKMIRLAFYGGDTMLGRAVQLSFPVQAAGEEDIKDSCTASRYVDLSLNHPSESGDPSLSRIRDLNRDGSYLWGDLLSLNIDPPPACRFLNLETAVTSTINNSDIPNKGINYHMHSDNFIPALTRFQQITHNDTQPSPVVMSCANNHILDFGRRALDRETLPLLDSFHTEHFHVVGCGANFDQASRPARVTLPNYPVNDNIPQQGEARCVEAYGFATECSGTPKDWWAGATQSGVSGLPGLHDGRTLQQALDIVRTVFSPPSSSSIRPLRIVSIHWGPNWAGRWERPQDIRARRAFAHELIDRYDVDVIYGHSSHHIRGLELYHNKLIMYGTGDLVNDYEGFENAGEERYNTMGGIFVVDLDAETGNLRDIRVVPTFMDRLQLKRWTPESAMWKPNERRLVKDRHMSEKLCRFINEMSRTDAETENNESLLLNHVESDPQIPGGPVLKASVP